MYTVKKAITTENDPAVFVPERFIDFGLNFNGWISKVKWKLAIFTFETYVFLNIHFRKQGISSNLPFLWN